MSEEGRDLALGDGAGLHPLRKGWQPVRLRPGWRVSASRLIWKSEQTIAQRLNFIRTVRQLLTSASTEPLQRAATMRLCCWGQDLSSRLLVRVQSERAAGRCKGLQQGGGPAGHAEGRARGASAGAGLAPAWDQPARQGSLSYEACIHRFALGRSEDQERRSST